MFIEMRCSNMPVDVALAVESIRDYSLSSASPVTGLSPLSSFVTKLGPVGRRKGSGVVALRAAKCPELVPYHHRRQRRNLLRRRHSPAVRDIPVQPRHSCNLTRCLLVCEGDHVYVQRKRQAEGAFFAPLSSIRLLTHLSLFTKCSTNVDLTRFDLFPEMAFTDARYGTLKKGDLLFVPCSGVHVFESKCASFGVSS